MAAAIKQVTGDATVRAGRVTLDRDDAQGYLASLLKHLNVPASSQSLVFSKTSFQRERISPRTPRALYFNDDVYVGSVHEGKAVEIAGVKIEQ